MGCEVDRQFSIDDIADHQTSGLQAVLERPLRDLAERRIRNQEIEQDIGIEDVHRLVIML